MQIKDFLEKVKKDLDSEFSESFPLPSPNDSFLTLQGDYYNNSCFFDWSKTLGLYAFGYKEAADVLVRNIVKRNAGQDLLVYPVMFLYRHYLELEIKNLIFLCNHYQDNTANFSTIHGIDQLWGTCNKLLSEIFPNESITERKETTRLINEFSKIDSNSMAFRYPHNKDGKTPLLNISKINLHNVQDVMEKISNLFSGAEAQIGEYLSFKEEAHQSQQIL
jgi:hypothetical protein